MHASDYAPVHLSAAITTGNIGRIADVAAQVSHDLAKLDRSLADTLADLDRRLAKLEGDKGDARPIFCPEV